MIEEIISKFNINGELIEVSENKSGNINNTYVVAFKMQDGSIIRFVIQKINTTVFTEPYKLMKNIERVTKYLKKQMEKEGDKEHRVLDIVNTKEDNSLCFIIRDGEKDYYRVYDYIENAVTYDCSTDPEIVYNAARGFGNFQRLLRDFPMSELNETIKDFHSTDKRYKRLIEDIKIDPFNRAMEVAPEIVFILKREDICSKITKVLGTKEVPYRVTHNDTKVNNVMMNKDTGDFLAVVDLDTVMPGSLLYDYGDGIRAAAATTKEDDTDLDKVGLNLEFFEAYTRGFLSEMAPYITAEELSLMGESIRIITLELGIRFLNDYINGDTYFKTSYEKHNLDRTRNQLRLVEDIESKMDYINNFIYQCYEESKAKPKVFKYLNSSEIQQ